MNTNKYTKASIALMFENFKNHRASVTKTNMGTFIDWREPQTGVFAVRYILSGHYLYVSGDLGEYVFNLAFEAETLCSKKFDYDYLIKKLSACGNNEAYAFSSEGAIETIEYMACGEENSDAYKCLLDYAKECTSLREWTGFINSAFCDSYESFCLDNTEWIYDCGKVYSDALVGVLYGLEMAFQWVNDEIKITLKDVVNLVERYNGKWTRDVYGKSILYYFKNGDHTRIELVDDKKSIAVMGKIIGGLSEFEKWLQED